MADSEAAADTTDPDATDDPAGTEAAIRAANEELLERAGDGLKLPITVLVEQRDEALRQVEALRSEAERQRVALIAEQDQFITFLMADQEKKVFGIELELKEARERLERQDALEPKDLGSSSAEVERLQGLLEAAYSEVDETRTDAARLQGDLDDALRSRDDLRLEMFAQVEAARDEAFAIQTQLDATNRLLEDARDHSRDEAFRAIEDLDEVRRELDERTNEVRRLRNRLQELEGARNSQPPPPPPGPGPELERARQDVQTLRKQLIDTKRELSRVSRELALAGTRRISRPDLAASPDRHSTQPGLGVDLPPDSKPT